ncbi:unnamed protein product [Linum tenue]|uniref:Pectinesterase n=1 Tax=Linum tenue TaxID=586396 RepID=A0AAV0KDX3_9ROSI|nr:unnamed protein product [Linum tenue]
MAGRVITVAQDGTGDFTTVQAAVDSVPFGNNFRTVIRVAPGVYRQPVPEDTVLTWNNSASRIDHHQGERLIGTGTFGCGSVIVEGEGSGQAVALRVTADRCGFYNCRFLGWQDTLYLHYGKQYLKDCYIEGSVDFIFGNSTALLEHCHIHCKSEGFITAQARKSSQESTGYVFLRRVVHCLSDLFSVVLTFLHWLRSLIRLLG